MFPNLKAEMARKGVTMSDLAKRIDVTLPTLSNKMAGKYQFTLREITEIKRILKVDIPLEILFEVDDD